MKIICPKIIARLKFAPKNNFLIIVFVNSCHHYVLVTSAGWPRLSGQIDSRRDVRFSPWCRFFFFSQTPETTSQWNQITGLVSKFCSFMSKSPDNKTKNIPTILNINVKANIICDCNSFHKKQSTLDENS